MKFNFHPSVTCTDYNTNNAWGFGGSYGREWTFPNGFKFRRGQACFRHLPSRRIEYHLNADGQKISPEEFRAACAEWL